MRLFCYRPGAIGDTILTAPALAWLRDRNPDAALSLAARSDLHEILRASGLADEALSPDDARFAAFFTPGASGLDFSRRFGFAPDRAYIWMNHADDFAANLVRAGVKQVAVAAARPGVREVYSAAELFCAFSSVADERSDPQPATQPAPEFFRRALISAPPRAIAASAGWLQARALRGPAPLLVLHVGAGGAAKLLPAAASRAMLCAWRAAGGEFCLTCGPADETALSELKAVLSGEVSSDEVERRTARLSLAEACGLFTFAAVAAGADSGPLHLAAAEGVRTLIFFTKSDPRIWKPIGPQARVVDCRDLAGHPHGEATFVQRASDALRALL